MVSEEELRKLLEHTKVTAYAQGRAFNVNLSTVIQKEDIDAIMQLLHQYGNTRELEGKLQEHEMLQHQARVNLKSAEAVAQWSEIRVKQIKGEE